MLDPAKIPAKGNNEQGSVLLAVVCMGMVTMSLATIALSMINYSTKATARNVERSQAKITAEAALTEFVASYNSNYEDLKTFAEGRTSTSTPIDVTITNGTTDNTAQYGNVQINVYEQGSGFKVTSTCDYMGQVQTASLVFAAKETTPYMPTHALESSDGSNYGGCAWPMDGEMYLERGTDSNDLMTFHNANAEMHTHVYTEYNTMFDTCSGFKDVANTTGSKNFAPNKYLSDTESAQVFNQAFTFRSKGYLNWNNTSLQSTSAGKTDINGCNSETATVVGMTYKNLYDATDGYSYLSNLDGWMMSDTKILITGNANTTFGADSSTTLNNKSNITADTYRPIDMYCHGMYFGRVPTTIGTNDNSDEVSDINNTYGGNCQSESNMVDYTINGDIYCYKGTSSGYSDNGNMVIDLDGGHTVNVYGDVVCNGTLYISSGSVIDLHGWNLYCDDIRDLSSGATLSAAEISARIKSTGGSGTVVKNVSEMDPGNKTTRNEMPTIGYSPTVGTQASTRAKLTQTYNKASPNDIFEESLPDMSGYSGGVSHPHHDAAKDIAENYATALTRTLDTPCYDSTGAPLTETHTGTVSGTQVKITDINASLRLKSSDFATQNTLQDIYGHVYNIKLTNKDIVVALPISSAGSLHNLRMRVDSTNRTEDVFVYFMYYDDSAPNFKESVVSGTPQIEVNCYYLNNEDATAQIERYTSTSSTETVRVVMKKTTPAQRSTKVVKYSNEQFDTRSLAVGDPFFWKDWPDEDHVELADYVARLSAPLPTIADLRTFNTNAQQNLSVYFVPDDVKFVMTAKTAIQGIVYATKSDVDFGDSVGDTTYVYGQVKCKTFRGPGNQDAPIIFNIPPARGSLVDYFRSVNATTSDIDIQYYQY